MANNAGARLTRHYTDTQRDALLQAVLVDGMSQAEAERRAIDGTLAPGLAPFGRPRFIYQLIRRGRADFEASNDQALDSGHAGELRRLYLLALHKARQLDTTSDVAEIARHAKAVGEAHKALRGNDTRTKTPTRKTETAAAVQTGTPNRGAEPNDTLTELVGLATQRDTATPERNTPEPHEEAGRGPVHSVAR